MRIRMIANLMSVGMDETCDGRHTFNIHATEKECGGNAMTIQHFEHGNSPIARPVVERQRDLFWEARSLVETTSPPLCMGRARLIRDVAGGCYRRGST